MTGQRWQVPDEPEPLSLFQRLLLRRLHRRARRSRGSVEPLQERDWAAVWAVHHMRSGRLLHRLFAALPSSPRCCQCGAPFAGIGRLLTRPLGYRPSRKSPHYCATCVELSPPGGATMLVGVLFADIRGFTGHAETADPRQVTVGLQRFYGLVEDVVFPEGILDKLLGDGVMALYLGPSHPGHAAPQVMLEHACDLLRRLAPAAGGSPTLPVGVGLDYGEAYVGNVGERAVHDFTAIGDVVNTAARLQTRAAAGEIVYSSRVADHVSEPPGVLETLTLRGRQQPERVYRHVPWSAAPQ